MKSRTGSFYVLTSTRFSTPSTLPSQRSFASRSTQNCRNPHTGNSTVTHSDNRRSAPRCQTQKRCSCTTRPVTGHRDGRRGDRLNTACCTVKNDCSAVKFVSPSEAGRCVPTSHRAYPRGAITRCCARNLLSSFRSNGPAASAASMTGSLRRLLTSTATSSAVPVSQVEGGATSASRRTGAPVTGSTRCRRGAELGRAAVALPRSWPASWRALAGDSRRRDWADVPRHGGRGVLRASRLGNVPVRRRCGRCCSALLEGDVACGIPLQRHSAYAYHLVTD